MNRIAAKSPPRRTARPGPSADAADSLDHLWRTLPGLLAAADDWALRDVLNAGVAAYTSAADTPAGLLIRHDPDGAQHLVRVNLDGPDTVIRRL